MLSILFYVLTFMPFIFVLILEDSLEFWHKVLAVRVTNHVNFDQISILKFLQNLLMSTAFSMCSLYLTRYEQQSIGLHWDNLWESPLVDDRMNFGVALMCLLADCLLYFLIGVLIVYFKGKKKNSFSQLHMRNVTSFYSR